MTIKHRPETCAMTCQNWLIFVLAVMMMMMMMITVIIIKLAIITTTKRRPGTCVLPFCQAD